MPSKNPGKLITRIKVNKNTTSIYFGKEKLTISNETKANFYLYEGKTLSYKELDEIKKIEDASKYLKYCLSLLNKNVYTEWRIREKLYAKGADKGVVDRLVILLKKNDLICDDAFIEDYLGYANEKGYGKNKIIANLTRKGIFKSDIAKISFPLAKERSKAKKHVNKLIKKYEKYNETSKRVHIKQALIRAGFDVEIANEMINDIPYSKEKDELSKLKKDYDQTLVRLKRKYKGHELKEKTIQTLVRKGYRINDVLKVVR